MELKQLVEKIGQEAREAAAQLAGLNPDVKNKALEFMAKTLKDNDGEIKKANEIDIAEGRKKGLGSAMLDRLLLNDKRIEGMVNSLHQIAQLDDPVGEIYDMKIRPNGLKVGRMRVPIGVVAIIYESRPNVTVEAAGLCLKSGNAVILRGGSEAINSNKKIAEMLCQGAEAAGISQQAIQLIPVTEREAVNHMLKLNQYIDLIIPRGGRGLIETVVKNSTIPVIKHYDGNCYIYVDEDVSLGMAEKIIINAKTQRPGVCNALESLLIHKSVALELLQRLVPVLKGKGVEIKGDEQVRQLYPELKPTSEEDWYTEYLELILSVGIVDNYEEAIRFINCYGSHHTDAIITENYDRALQFLRRIDSACVFVNCSTRFSDGGEFGLGAEIGISTDKLHARGPMGLKELTTSKFVVLGNGQIRP